MQKYELECSNMFYMPNFNIIGGTETFMFELARKYRKYDITIVYRYAHENQLKRMAKYVRMHKYEGGLIKCKKAFFNYSIDIIDNIEAKEYIQIIHAMYKTNKLKPFIHEKMTDYFAVSKGAGKEWEELTGIKPKIVRNPLQITQEEEKPTIFFISATRLTSEKGKWRMEKLVEELDRLKEELGFNYIYLIFTNDTDAIRNPNIVYLSPRLDIRPYIKAIKGKGYGIQLSDCEGDCYFTRECEAFGVPLIVTPIPSFKEQGLVEGVNCYYVPFDMKDLKLERFVNIPQYEGYIGTDEWDKYLIKDKSNYKEVKMKARVRCIVSYWDVKLNPKKQEMTPVGYEWIVDEKRANYLKGLGLVEIVEIVPDKENKKLPEEGKNVRGNKPPKKK